MKFLLHVCVCVFVLILLLQMTAYFISIEYYALFSASRDLLFSFLQEFSSIFIIFAGFQCLMCSFLIIVCCMYTISIVFCYNFRRTQLPWMVFCFVLRLTIILKFIDLFFSLANIQSDQFVCKMEVRKIRRNCHFYVFSFFFLFIFVLSKSNRMKKRRKHCRFAHFQNLEKESLSNAITCNFLDILSVVKKSQQNVKQCSRPLNGYLRLEFYYWWVYSLISFLVFIFFSFWKCGLHEHFKNQF